MCEDGLLAKNHKDSSRLYRPINRGSVNASFKATVAALTLAASLYPTTVLAQGLLGGLLNAISKQNRQQEEQRREQQQMLGRIATAINARPYEACKIPQRDIERWLTDHVNDEGLMDNVSRTVFRRELRQEPQNGLEALSIRVARETREREARANAADEALRTGRPAPIGDLQTREPPPYKAFMTDITATSRIDNGLNCSANVRVDFLRFPIVYTFKLDPAQADGWDAQLQSPPFTEEHALTESSVLRISFSNRDLPLMQARRLSDAEWATRTAAAETARQQKDAEAAFRNSPAGRAAAAARERALSAEYKRRGLACQNNGGTWGYRFDSRTIVEVTPGEVPPDLMRFSLGCYRL